MPQQRKNEKHRKKREIAKKKAQQAQPDARDAIKRLLAVGARSPFGPCWISGGLEEDPPNLAGVVITRALPDGRFLPAIALVDRTCLGVKDGFVLEPMNWSQLHASIDRFNSMFEDMRRCEPMFAQSVVYHAIDYAERLGFEPNPDFSDAMFGPRPAELLATPMCARQRPFYACGPHDNIALIVSRLKAAVGPDGFDAVAAAPIRKQALQMIEQDDEMERMIDQDAQQDEQDLDET